MTTIGTLRNRAEAATGRHGDDAPMSTKHPLLAERALTVRLFSEVRDRPDSVTYHVHRNRIGGIDAAIALVLAVHASTLNRAPARIEHTSAVFVSLDDY